MKLGHYQEKKGHASAPRAYRKPGIKGGTSFEY
jgi:hypothetical protein